MTLDQRIKAEQEKVSGKLAQLREDNAADHKLLEELTPKYQVAVFDSNVSVMEETNAQIKEIGLRINQRKEMIQALEDKNNPVIQNMILEEIRSWESELAILEEQAMESLKELEPLKNELLKGLDEINTSYNRAKNLRGRIGSWRNSLSVTNKKQVKDYDILGPICNQLRSFIIREGDIFKR